MQISQQHAASSCLQPELVENKTDPTAGGGACIAQLRRSQRSLRMTLLAQALLLLGSILMLQARQPHFSWERLPRFWHAGNASGPLNTTLVKFVAQRGWAMATIEKMQAQEAHPKSRQAEAKIIAAARQLKTASVSYTHLTLPTICSV